MTDIAWLASCLTPEKVLSSAQDGLVACGGIPLGIDQKVDDFILGLSGKLMKEVEGKTPHDFFFADITVKSPEEQIPSRVEAFAQKVIRRQHGIIQEFQGESNHPNHEVLSKISRALIGSMKTAVAGHFVEEFKCGK